jgi:hypothetical protein
MKTHNKCPWPLLAAINAGLLLYFAGTPEAEAGKKGNPPPSPTPTPTATPAPSPTPTPGSSPTPANTSKAASADTTIDNRFVTMAVQLGDGRKEVALDVYSNALVHANARIATAQGFFTASQRGVSGMIQNPTPSPAPSVDPLTLFRNDLSPKTAVDWGWAGNKKSKKEK